jgi:hypothetical protein
MIKDMGYGVTVEFNDDGIKNTIEMPNGNIKISRTSKRTLQLRKERDKIKSSGKSSDKFIPVNHRANKKQMDNDGYVMEKHEYPEWNDPTIPRAVADHLKPPEPDLYREIFNVVLKKKDKSGNPIIIRQAILDVASMTATWSWMNGTRIKWGKAKVARVFDNQYAEV